MTDDSTLDSFGDGASAESVDSDGPTSTFAWTPTAEPCQRCGAEIRSRWRSDDGFVCADCVEW